MYETKIVQLDELGRDSFEKSEWHECSILCSLLPGGIKYLVARCDEVCVGD